MNKTFWPMLATWFRVLIVPIIILLMMCQPPDWNFWSALLFMLASFTDWLDGYLARKFNAVSDMGKFLDPVADKVLVSSILILLIPLERIEAIAVLLLLNRDILIGGLRSMAASKGTVIAADKLGKWKTAIQMISIPALLWGGVLYSPNHANIINIAAIGYFGIWISVVLSWISGIQYARRYFQQQKL